MQQKILRAEAQKETGRWESRWTVRGLLADGRCGQAVLDFLSSTDVRRIESRASNRYRIITRLRGEDGGHNSLVAAARVSARCGVGAGEDTLTSGCGRVSSRTSLLTDDGRYFFTGASGGSEEQQNSNEGVAVHVGRRKKGGEFEREGGGFILLALCMPKEGDCNDGIMQADGRGLQ